jgi:hypothetical protein
LAKGLSDIIEHNAEEDKFMASLILCKEIANRLNGKFCGEAWDAISRYVYTG